MSIICDGSIFRQIIADFGATVTVREVTDASYNTRGDVTETTTDHTGIKAFVYVLSQIDESVKEGDFKSGDIIFYFDTQYESYMVRGNRIQYNSLWYQIEDITWDDIGGTKYFFAAKTKKI